MKKLLLVLCLLSLTAAGCANTKTVQEGLVIVRDGRAQSVIVTAESPSATAQHAASELQHFIEVMSGAKLSIQTDAATVPAGQIALAVGRSRLTAGMDIPAGEDRDRSREGFVLKTLSDRIVLAGNEDANYHGTEYAVYDFLERLGCRWYYPGDYGQVVPKQSTIIVPPLDVAETPSFVVRNIWNSGWASGAEGFGAWLLRNKGTDHRHFAFPGDGSIVGLAPPAKYAKEFPEIYALGKDGKRHDETTAGHETMLCTTNPKTVEIAAETIRAFFREHPEANSYAFSPPDNNAMCYCPPCLARMHDFQSYAGYESISDPFFNFANNVAWEVTKDFPDKYIVAMSYYSRVTPPEGLEQPWNPNIIVQSAQLWVSAVRPIETDDDIFAKRQLSTIQAWSRQAKKLLIYDYDPHADLSRMPYWRSHAIGRDMKLYKRHGVIGFTTEGQPTYFRTGLNYYVRARCMWDVDTDVDALLDDYYRSFFGPAAGPMRRFGTEIESMLQATPDHLAWRSDYADWSPTFPPARVAALGKLLDKAEALADGPEVARRISLYRILHTYMTTLLHIFELKHHGQYAQALKQCDMLAALVEEAQTLQPGLMPDDPGWVLDRGSGLNAIKWHLTKQVERTDGVHGELLGIAPVQAGFRADSGDVGIFEQWQHPEVAATVKWSPIDLRKDWGLNGFRDREMAIFDGYGWYQIAFPVDAPSAGRAQLVVPLVNAKKLWIWVNGALVYSPTTPLVEPTAPAANGAAQQYAKRGNIWLGVDVQDHIKPATENVFTFRMTGSSVWTRQRGICERPYVWAPIN